MDTDAAQRRTTEENPPETLTGNGSQASAHLPPGDTGSTAAVAGHESSSPAVEPYENPGKPTNPGGSSTLGQLVRTTSTDVGPSPIGSSTGVLEIDGDELTDRDLETLTASTVPSDGTTARPTTGRRFVLPRLQLDERLGRIALALVLSVLLWLYVLSLGNPINTTGYPRYTVEIRNVGPQLKVINTLPEVDATVQGQQSVLATLNRSDIKPYVDLAGVPQGVHDVPVLADVDPSKRGDLTINFSPNRVQVQLELQVTRVFTVSVQVNGTPAFGYKPEPAKVTPDRVSVTGSQEAVGRVVKVVVPVDIEGKAGTQQGSKTPVALDANGQEVKGLTFEPATVQVEVPMKLLLNGKAVAVRVPIVGQPAAGYSVSSVIITPTNVTVCCSPSEIEQITVLETQPVAITGTTTSIITSTSLILPPGVELYADQPDKISVAINVDPLQTTVRLAVAPTILGLAPGFTALVSPTQVDVTVSGTFNQLQGLSPTSIRAVVNAEGRSPGAYTVTPQVIVPPGVKLENSSPQQVTLTIIAATPVPTQTPAPVPTLPATPTRSPEAPSTATPTPTVPRPTNTPTLQPTPSSSPTPSPTPQPSPTPTATPEA
jgi:YbbR domain-containing protein